MKRALLLPIAVLALVTMACSMMNGSAPSPESQPTATQITVVEPVESTATSAPEPTKAVIEEPTAAPEPTATESPTETPAGPFEYIDTFDRNSQYWSEDFIVTTQTSGRDVLSKGVIQDGLLSFRFDDKETYMYKFFTTPVEGNVSVEVDYQSIGHINNGIAIVCRVNADQTSWFEVRVSSTSDYSFFLYDKRRKTEEGKNPYLLLGKGKLKIDELAPTKPNTIKLTCGTNELVLDANKGKRIISQPLETLLDGTGIGLGGMSYDVLPIKVNIDQVTIRGEE